VKSNGKERKEKMRLKIAEISGRLVVMTAFVVITSIASYGQNIVPGNMEVTGHLGVVGGIGSHGSFGGSLGAPVTDRLILAGDLSYIPLGGGSVTVLGATMRSSARAFNFNGNLQYQFNPYHAVVPYAGAGLGFLHSSFNTSSSGVGGSSLNVQGSSTDLYFNTGGGFRYYVKERWGFKPEFMIFAGSNTYVRFAGGIFYQFGE
jgi:outer membrane protein with beta-barrel domain